MKERIFMLCCKFLDLMGKVLHLTYQQVSVIFNLWIQGGILVVSALLVAVFQSVAAYGSPSWNNVAICLLGLSYCALHVIGFIWILHRYHLPVDYAFELCVSDLEEVARRWKTSYYTVNILVFIIFYLILLSLNVTFAYLTWNNRI